MQADMQTIDSTTMEIDHQAAPLPKPPKAGGGGIRTIAPEDEPLVLAHRSNSLDALYNAYYSHSMRSFEIDVQMSKDRRIVVYHDNCANRTVRSLVKEKMAITLYDFLYHTPDHIVINVEIKHYSNNHKHDIVTNLVLAQCRKFKYKKFIFSSFNPIICGLLKKKHVEVYQLIETDDQLHEAFLPNIMVHKDLLHTVVNDEQYSKVGVWGVDRGEGQVLLENQPKIRAVVVDVV
jgi:glycerophosphoryl diester phosphodiesterase